MIYAVSVRQPLASLLLAGVKRFEARSWHPERLGWLLLHASTNTAFTKQDLADDPDLVRILKAHGMESPTKWTPSGAIIGAFEVVEVHHSPPPDYNEVDRLLAADVPDILWRIGKTKWFNNPVPCNGKLSLFQPPSEVMKRVRKQFPL